MIQEQYISFEVAKLLKNRDDFHISSKSHYNAEGNLYFTNMSHYNLTAGDGCIAPTQQLVMRWLREVHNLCIEPYRTACGYLYTISTIPYGSCKCNPKVGGDDEDSGQWTSYEKVCESAIKYCLTNLI